MSIITKVLKQTAVWWARTTPDAYGQFTFASPVEVKVRWEDSIDTFKDENGNEHTSKSYVMVDRDMKVGDVLMLGTTADIPSSNPADPKENSGAFEIKRFDKTPDIRNRENLREAYL